jgi:hypothetical protein
MKLRKRVTNRDRECVYEREKVDKILRERQRYTDNEIQNEIDRQRERERERKERDCM